MQLNETENEKLKVEAQPYSYRVQVFAGADGAAQAPPTDGEMSQDDMLSNLMKSPREKANPFKKLVHPNPNGTVGRDDVSLSDMSHLNQQMVTVETHEISKIIPESVANFGTVTGTESKKKEGSVNNSPLLEQDMENESVDFDDVSVHRPPEENQARSEYSKVSKV